jgi:hypothetical protein
MILPFSAIHLLNKPGLGAKESTGLKTREIRCENDLCKANRAMDRSFW